MEEEESDTGREFSMRLTPPTLALPFAEDNAGPVLCTLFSACRKRDKGGPGRNPPLLLSRFQISGYDLSRWIDYLDRRYFHIPVVNFASALALTSPPRAKKNVGILVLLVDDGDKHFVQDRSFARFLIFSNRFFN